jgi:hypothetical protein
LCVFVFHIGAVFERFVFQLCLRCLDSSGGSRRDEFVGSYGRISTLMRPAILPGQTSFHPSPGMKS